MLIFCWFLPLLVKNDAATFEVKKTNHSQDKQQQEVGDNLSVCLLNLPCKLASRFGSH